MNDPGLHEPAQDAAQDVEKDAHKKDEEQAAKEERTFLDPRLASTGDMNGSLYDCKG